MTQILYNLRTSDLGYRITKFSDGEVEASYLTSDQACDCPAGHRATCRHRQMLSVMLARHLANSDLFWDFDRGFSCDINGNVKRETVACAPAEQDTELTAEEIEQMRDGLEKDLQHQLQQTEIDNSVAAGPHVEEDTVGLGKVTRIKFPPDFKIEETVDLVVPAGQHTAAEGLPPEQTVYDVMTGITTPLPKATWRRL